ncbi:Crp/Fnr family transcriptional regulator [Micromonospora sp. NPDC049891]|uniref:Crp/Fnr family transcriptional regulator n=1 Tax=Micromonospora sp. NPDC049891 TaxID=3155655 RepID=UPI0034060AA7
MTSLAAIPALSALPPTALNSVFRDSRGARYGAGTLIRPAGQPARAVVLLLTGTVVAAYTGPSGAQVWPARWEGPAIVDKPSILGGGVPTTDLVATTACLVRLLPPARFLRLLDEEQSVRQRVLGRLSQDVLAGRHRMALSATQPAVSQLAAWVKARGGAAQATVWRGSQEELGRALGLSRVTVNRALRRLVQAGALHLTPRGIMIVDHRLLDTFLDHHEGTPPVQ